MRRSSSPQLNPSRSLFCGISAGALAQFTFQPVDVIRTRSQALGRGEFANASIALNFRAVVRDIYVRERLGGFFTGSRPAMFGAGVSWGLYFAVYNFFKRQIVQFRGGGKNAPIVGPVPSAAPRSEFSVGELCLASGTAGALISVVMHPVFLLKTRLQLNGLNEGAYQYRGAMDGLVRIVRSEGVRGLFVGLPASLLSVSHGIVFFVMYDNMKGVYLRRRRSRRHRGRTDLESGSEMEMGNFLPAHAAATISAISKVMAVMVSYPVSVVKTRVQDQQNVYHRVRYRGIWDAFLKMARSEGPMTFYRGIVPALARSVPSGAVTLAIYEMLSRAWCGGAGIRLRHTREIKPV